MDEQVTESAVMRQVRGHRYILFVIGAIIVSLLLVLVALALYTSSGAAQLDLSRPGYEAIREQVHDDETYRGFNSSGTLDAVALDEFSDLYTKKLDEAQSVDAFGGDVLSPKLLQISGDAPAKSAEQ